MVAEVREAADLGITRIPGQTKTLVVPGQDEGVCQESRERLCK